MGRAWTPTRALRAWIEGALDVVYPPTCLGCQERLGPGESLLCARCIASTRLDRAWMCPRCGARGLGAAPETGRPCRLCPPPDAAWRGSVSASGYGPVAAACVHAFKYGRRFEAGELMARQMRRELREPLESLGDRLTMVAPVPIHWRRRLWRGFNQSDRLARAIAEELGLPCRMDLLRRSKHTKRQALLPREARVDNVRDAFATGSGLPPGALAGQGVLLVDDVVTTGATVEACARALLEAGARETWVACFARARAGGPPASEEELLVAPSFGEEDAFATPDL